MEVLDSFGDRDWAHSKVENSTAPKYPDCLPNRPRHQLPLTKESKKERRGRAERDQPMAS